MSFLRAFLASLFLALVVMGLPFFDRTFSGQRGDYRNSETLLLCQARVPKHHAETQAAVQHAVGRAEVGAAAPTPPRTSLALPSADKSRSVSLLIASFLGPFLLTLFLALVVMIYAFV